MADGERQRVDKWLWFARVTKTRTGAQALATSGRVRLNRQKIDTASQPVRVGDVLTVRLDSSVRVLRVAAIGKRRGPAAEARELFADLAPAASSGSERSGPRPTKRHRRAIDALRRNKVLDQTLADLE